VVVDHVSLSWSTDEVFSTWYPGVRDITVSHCIIAEAIDKAQQSNSDHSKGFLIGDHTRRLSMIRNVLAHNDDRNPIWKGDTSAVAVNNFIFNPGRWPVSFFDDEGRGPLRASLIGNDFVYGPSSQAEHHTVLVARTVRAGSQIHLRDNRDPNDDTDGDGYTNLARRVVARLPRVGFFGSSERPHTRSAPG